MFETSCNKCIFRRSVASVESEAVFFPTCIMGQWETLPPEKIDMEKQLVKTICPYLRTKQWIQLHQLQTEKEIIKQIQEETKLKLTVMIYTANEDTLAELETTIGNIASQTLQPYCIRVVSSYNINFTPADIRDILQELDGLWGIDLITEDEIDEDYAQMFRCIDVGLRNVKTMYYGVIDAGSKINFSILENIDKYIKENYHFIMLEPTELHPMMVINTRLHRLIGGSRIRPIHLKLRDLAKAKECPQLIMSIDQFA